MLKNVAISHYRSLSDVSLSFERINVIVGPNGSGKSNLIDCLNFIKDATTDDLDYATTKRHGVESIRQWSRSRPYNINIELKFEAENGSGRYKVSLSSSKGTFRVVEESGQWSGETWNFPNRETLNEISFVRFEDSIVRFSSTLEDPTHNSYFPHIEFPKTELFLTQLAGRTGATANAMFRDLVAEINAIATYSIYPNIIRQPQLVSKEIQLANDGSNLASIIKALNSGQKHNKDRLVDALRTVLPVLSDILVKSAGGFYVPIIRVDETGGAHDLNMSQISDGTLRMLGLLTAFYQPNAPKRIAFEEPEQMIHPGLLLVLKDACDDYLEMVRGSQFFMTTHSPNYLDLVSPDDIIWMKFRDGISEAGRISERQKILVKDQLFSAGELLVSEGFVS